MDNIESVEKINKIIEAINAQPEDIKHVWVSGQCAAFAIALARIIERDCGVPSFFMSISVGTRYGFESEYDFEEDEDIHTEVTVFSHATLEIEVGDQSFDIDCNGDNAMSRWEDNFEETEMHLDEDYRSTFDWDQFAVVDIGGISQHIDEIDGSMPVQEADIVKAMDSIDKFVLQMKTGEEKSKRLTSSMKP